jgi:hypothetical protein
LRFLNTPALCCAFERSRTAVFISRLLWTLRRGGDHVGSIAVRRAIERWQPRLTMHGHIHESCRLHRGQFAQVVARRGGRGDGSDVGCGGDVGGGGGGSVVITVGNDFREPNPHCIIVRTDRPEEAVRVECAPLSK